MNVQFLSNEKGKVVAVQVPLKEWKEMAHKLEAYNIATAIQQALKEVELIQSGKLKSKSIEELLDEL